MAESISKEIVDRTWQEMADITDEDAAEVAAEMRLEQPTLQNFLMGRSDVYTQYEKELGYYLSVVVWRIMSHSQRRLGRVSKARLAQASHKNAELLKMLSQDSDADFYSAIQILFEHYPEPEVLRFIAEAILEESQDPQEPGFREDVRGMAFVYLKTVLDALIFSLWKSEYK